ncbi:hypothetical protein AOXY_G14832 [Acipenser oxyrinchus oxyrinchus]|uniref:WD repeat- and FYVE domain-containing protein 4 n=1 Tax=Acipenser oxyrinchus oxyrinchus TaxID=40147 RepID=A0AAD8D8F4_ACIOX|nr:hypothetical protein AOXY_G14832 [Acipenser oxyrinchus oxyrinchus]
MESRQESEKELQSSGTSTDYQLKDNKQEDTNLTSIPNIEEMDSTQALTILRKKLLQFEQSIQQLKQDEREQTITNLLPLFIKIAENTARVEKLANIQTFTGEIAQIMVENIEEKLRNKPAEEARFAVEQFIQWKEEVSTNKGWLLLKSVWLLCSVDSETESIIITSGIPAILLKCLYLFVAFPSNSETTEDNPEHSFQEIFTQTLLKLCSDLNCVEEMVQTRELQCLIIAMTSLWDQCCSSWRRSASLVLRAISSVRALNTVKSLQAMNCIKICTQNLAKIVDQVPPSVLAEVAVSVFSFIKDSYSTSPGLLAEFENNEGYRILQKILCRSEAEMNEENGKPVEDLLNFIAHLTLCGQAELKVAICVSNPQPPGFRFDPPLATGTTVKNLPAFRILQSAFQQSGSTYICTQILSTIKQIWTWTRANFFLLEWTLQSLSQLADSICLKPLQIHTQFFQLVEMVVFELDYIPHETLQKIQYLIKENFSTRFTMAALKCFYNLTIHTVLFNDVFSDSGLLKLLLDELRKQAKILRKAGITGNKKTVNEQDAQKELTTAMLKVVAALVLRSVKNTVFLRDCGMVPYIKIFLDDQQYRLSTLCILEQLSVINPEEYMSIAIGALCSSTEGELLLKQDLLQSLLKVLETPKGCCAFRTAGGFNGLLSLIVDMEGALCDQPAGEWATVDLDSKMDLILLTLHTITVAIHLDPVNSHFFQTTGHYEKMAEAIGLLGCFNEEELLKSDIDLTHCRTFAEFVDIVKNSKEQIPLSLRHCLQIVTCLEHVARGALNIDYSENVEQAPDSCEPQADGKNIHLETEDGLFSQGDQGSIRIIRSAACRTSTISSEFESRLIGESMIVHPGAICVMMTLLPKIYNQENTQLSMELQFAVTDHVQSLVKSERNRQIMCMSGLLHTLLTHCQTILNNTAHPLHLSILRIFEKLASQAIEHKLLRQFLRLRNPLKCAASKQKDVSYVRYQMDSHATSLVTRGYTDPNLNQDFLFEKRKSKSGFSLLNVSRDATFALHRIVSLVSMTSPRNFHPHNVSTPPSFVEFDMSATGYGCLFLPSLATIKGVNADAVTTGGHGTDGRGFPPSAGLSYSTWFLIRKFSSACDSHPVRLFTIVRHMSRMALHFMCLSVSISAPDCSLVITTEEEAFQFLDMMEPETKHTSSAPTSVRFMCSKLLIPGQWHHLAVVIAKDMKKTCKLSAYLNGKIIGTAKMQYIQPFPGQSISMEPTAVIDVYGIVGTPHIWKQMSSLIWRLGQAYLFEEVISSETVAALYKLGPNYSGNLQAVSFAGDDVNPEPSPSRLVNEERISFSINANSFSVTTVMDIKSCYNEVDSRQIAQEMGITSRDSSTPVYLARNLAQHLSGTARTIGAALVGHYGVRTFASNTAANSFQFIGGPSVILGFVAMASDDSSMYAAMKVLLSVLSSSTGCEKEMKRINGYKLLAFLLKLKSSLLSNRIFQLILSIVGTMELGCGSVAIQNHSAFKDILCDFEVWQNAPDNLDFILLTHYVDLLKSPSDGPRNAEVMHRMNVIKKLIFLLNEPSLTCEKVNIISTIMKNLLKGYFDTKDVLRLGLFLVYTLLPPSLNENVIFPENDLGVSTQALSQTPARTIWLRNQLLQMLLDLICSDNLHPSSKDQEEMFMALGSDWFLLFIQGHLHSTTVLLGAKLLIHFLYNPVIMEKFRDGIPTSSWLSSIAEDCAILMYNLKSHPWTAAQTACVSPGFAVLQNLLGHQVHIPQVYYLLAALFLQKPRLEVPAEKLDLDSMLQYVIENVSERQKICLCEDVAIVLLELVKIILSKPTTGTEDCWEIKYPGSVMQFFCLVHNLSPREPLWSSPGFLHALAGTIFPSDSQVTPQDCSVLSEGTCIQETVPPQFTNPARKQVCDFMRILLMDSLINIPAKKHLHPFELLLEFSPEKATHDQRQSFQTELLEFLMDIVQMTCREEGKATHLARDDYKISNSTQDRKIAILVGNVAFFSKKLVEKLYAGMFVVEPERILLFITDQIVVVLEKAYSQREQIVSILYNSLNRAILYFLSRPRQSLAEQQTIARSLKVLQDQWDIIFATYNSNVNFITCLMHCLVQIKAGSCPDGFGLKGHKKHPKGIWYHFLPKKNIQTNRKHELPNELDVQSELLKLVETTWSKLMSERRRTLEDSYKIDLLVKQGNSDSGMNISEITPLWEETASKAWQQFIASRKKKLAKVMAVHSQQGKSYPISSSLATAMRTAHRRFIKDTECTVEAFLTCMDAHRKSGQEMFAAVYKNHIQMLQCENNKTSKEWVEIEEQLLRERGLFGPEKGVFLPLGWSQDPAEGPARMRKKMRRNNPSDKKEEAGREYQATSKGLYFKFNPIEESQGVIEGSGLNAEANYVDVQGKEVDENGLDCNQLTFFPSLNETFHSEDFSEQCMETQVILQEMSEAEEVRMKLSVVIVKGHVISEGVLLFGKAHFYICENFTMSESREVYCTKHQPSRITDSFICNMFSKEKPGENPTCSRYPYEEVQEAHYMRFLLQDTALEIFLRCGESKFLVFQNKDQLKAFKRFCSAVPSLKGKGVTEAIINMRKNAGGEKTALHKWQKGKMSNFEYLMYLNTLAGRTYNDLMQYPVFPWIIADYDSETLDLSCPTTYRDLSKPMGAQTEERRAKFVQRYNEVENNDGDLSAQCHYCTHYSSAIIVASFLVRMEPFTTTFLSLQGGSFDVADRMFHSVKKEWDSASKDNMSDVRELIPEFFYLPDFLINSNKFEFGCMQDGTTLGDVVLPKWAKGDPREFIRLQREALESDYVSANLHLWIDLIFGFKQQGPAAVEAVNVCHPYFNGDLIDLANMKDPLKKSTILGFVSNFGQIPRQLFTKPHPPRLGNQKSNSGKEATSGSATAGDTQPFFFNLNKLKPSVQALKELIGAPVGHIVCGEKEVFAVEKNKLMIPPLWNMTFSWGFNDHTSAFKSYGTEKSFAISESLADWGQCLCASCPTQSSIITAGTSTVVCVWEISISKDKLKHMKLKQALYGHTDDVTCLATSLTYSVVISGSLDRTCIIWDYNRLNYITQLPEHNAGLSAVAINDLTGDIASCAGPFLYLWTIKGQLISSINTSCGPEGDILCCCFTQKFEWDSRNVIVTGCADGIVRLWKTEYVKTQLPAHQVDPVSPGHTAATIPEETGKKWEKHLVLCRELNRSQENSQKRYKNNPAVTALAISRTQNTLLVGDAWGRVFSWSTEG